MKGNADAMSRRAVAALSKHRLVLRVLAAVLLVLSLGLVPFWNAASHVSPPPFHLELENYRATATEELRSPVPLSSVGVTTQGTDETPAESAARSVALVDLHSLSNLSDDDLLRYRETVSHALAELRRGAKSALPRGTPRASATSLVRRILRDTPLRTGSAWSRLFSVVPLSQPELTHASETPSGDDNVTYLTKQWLCFFDMTQVSSPCAVDLVCPYSPLVQRADVLLEECLISCFAREVERWQSSSRAMPATLCDLRNTVLRSAGGFQALPTTPAIAHVEDATKRSLYVRFPSHKKCGRVHLLDLGVPESLFARHSSPVVDRRFRRPWKPIDAITFPSTWTKVFDATARRNVESRGSAVRRNATGLFVPSPSHAFRSMMSPLERALFSYHNTWQDDEVFEQKPGSTAPQESSDGAALRMEIDIPSDDLSIPRIIKGKLRVFLSADDRRVPQHALDLRIPIALSAGSLPLYRNAGENIVPFVHPRCDRCLPSLDGTIMSKIHGTRGLTFSPSGVTINWKEFNMEQYWLLREEARQYARRHMTTKASAAQIIKESLVSVGRVMVYLSPTVETCGLVAHATIHGFLDLGITVTVVKPADSQCAPLPAVTHLYGFDLSNEALCQRFGMSFRNASGDMFEGRQGHTQSSSSGSNGTLHLFFAGSLRDLEDQSTALDALQRYSDYLRRSGVTKQSIATAAVFSGRWPLNAKSRVCSDVLMRLVGRRDETHSPAIFSIRSTQFGVSRLRWTVNVEPARPDEAANDAKLQLVVQVLSQQLRFAPERILPSLPKKFYWQSPAQSRPLHLLCSLDQLRAGVPPGVHRFVNDAWVRSQRVLGALKRIRRHNSSDHAVDVVEVHDDNINSGQSPPRALAIPAKKPIRFSFRFKRD